MNDSLRWETIACPVCSSKNHIHWRTVQDRFKTLPEQSFSIVSCEDCGFRFLNPRPSADSIRRFYAHEEYDPFLSTKGSVSIKDVIYTWVRRYSIWRKRLLLETYHHAGRLLDVGCGTGEFLSTLRQYRWEVYGVEPDEEARSFARNERGLPIAADLDSLPSEPFDVITLWHVLEHLHDLMGGLEEIYSHLAPGGSLVLAMPNVDAWDMKRYQEDWIALDTPRHLYHFTEKDIRKVIPESKLHFVDTRGLWLDTLYNVIYSEQLHHRRTGRRYRPGYMIRSILGSYFHDWQNPTRRASASVYIFRKENSYA